MATTTIILVLLSFIFHSFLVGSQGPPKFNNNTDLESLLAFKSQITHDAVGVLRTWNLSSAFCNWRGVTCNLTKQRVTGINLENLGLVGTVSPYIGNLSFLNYLNLQNNSFLGNIPREVGQLFRLRTLILGSNRIQGTIPSSLSLCSKLSYLDLSVNRLEGTIPNELGVLSELQALSLMQNFLTGSIPSSFVNLSSLTNLILLSNSLHGEIPEGLGRLRFLINLQIGLNSISGDIPASLFNSSSLIVLAMAGNRLTGTLPSDMFTTLPSLTTLYLGGNLLSGPIPPSLGNNASKLNRVDLANNSFSGKIPLLWNLPKVEVLSLQMNQLVNNGDMEFINSLANSTQLQLFTVAENQLTGKLPSSIGNLSRQLSLLVMDHNFIEGSLPGEISNLINLTLIAFEYNSITGSIPPSIGSLPILQYIFLHENKFSGEIPESFGNLSFLSEVHLRNNLLAGTVPSSLGNCQRLQLLDLSVNLINGTIPRDIFGIRNFGKMINLSFNSLSGSVPSEIGNLNMIQAIDVGNNLLSGDIPISVGDCSSLLYLDMSRNLFQGGIPNSLSKLKGIEYIDLSSNNLTGNIPTSLQSLKFLQALKVSRNQLSGEVPKSGVFKNSTAFSLSGNLNLCGGAADLGLPKCSSAKKHLGGSRLKIVIISVFASVTFIIISVLVVIWSIRKKGSGVHEVNADANSMEGHPMYRQRELKLATRNFSSENLIGEGSFGSVYKGIFRNGSLAAIKVFKMSQQRASKSFQAEIEALRNIRHRNLVKIISVCSTGDFKALVLPFMPNGNLEQLLHPTSENQQVNKALDINQRLEIAINVASAMEYLHHDCETPVVHCDLKPSNVLLDGEMSAHVGDFGLARILLKNSPKSHLSSSLGLKGSIGYMAPEYGMGSGVSTRGDVYSFGILILEMFTRKRPTDNLFSGEIDLQRWVSMHLPGNFLEIVDEELVEKEWQVGNADGIGKMLNIGLMCAKTSPEERPTMREVSVMIKNVKANLSV